ncbi:MAG: hypothetical protein ACXWKH_20215 [Limisphaerales bacterium]
MTLQQALMDAGFMGLSDADALAYGNAVVVIGGSSALWTYKGVVDRFGLQAGEGLLAAIQGAGLAGAALTYINPGIDLSLAVTQSNLASIATAVPALAVVCEALKEIGITHGTRWQLWGVSQPVLADITAARSENANQQAVATFMNETLNPLLATNPTPAQIKSAVSAWSV